MDNKKKNIILLVILCVVFLLLGIFILIDIFSNEETDNIIINNNDNFLYDEDIKDIKEEISNISEDTDENDDLYNNDEKEEVNDAYLDNQVNDNNQNIYIEDDVVDHFESMGYEVENSSSFKGKFKYYFIAIVDFIFYDGEIKGYRFDELTDIAKVKIIAVALKIDSKIESFIPGYKDNISNVTGKVYTNVKEKLVSSYMDISSAICMENKEGCNKVKEIFADVKDYCKIGWDFIKNLFKNGTTKIRDWYEIYSGK